MPLSLHDAYNLSLDPTKPGSFEAKILILKAAEREAGIETEDEARAWAQRMFEGKQKGVTVDSKTDLLSDESLFNEAFPTDELRREARETFRLMSLSTGEQQLRPETMDMKMRR